MKQSAFLQIIRNETVGGAICYHSLLGAGELQFLYDERYIKVLDSFENRGDINESDDIEIVEDLRGVGFLVEDHVTEELERDEYRSIISKWLDKVVSGDLLDYLNLSISEACNFGCPHCSQACIPPNQDETKKIMTWEVAKESLDYYFEIIRKNNRKADIHFGSEEPLLNKKVFFKSVEYIKSQFPNAAISINTNLSLLDHKVADFFVANKIDVITSLDGLKSANDIMRPTKKGKGTFDVIIKNTELLKERGYPITGYITTILDANFELIDEEYIEWLASKGFTTMSYDVDLVNSMKHTPGECIEKILDLDRIANNHGILTTGVWRSPYENLVNGSTDGMPSYCKVTKGRGISINPDGDVFACSGSRIKFGNIKDGQEALFNKNSMYYRSVRSRVDRTGSGCEGCPIEVVCAGQCLMTNDFSCGIEVKSDRAIEFCQIYTHCTNSLLREKLAEEANA